MTLRLSTLIVAALCTASPLSAQAARPASPAGAAAETITAADVARRIGVLADDSMLGRDTPSRGLETAARYVADQFRLAGLTPGGVERRRGSSAIPSPAGGSSWPARASCFGAGVPRRRPRSTATRGMSPGTCRASPPRAPPCSSAGR